jgi:hypothetical protein
MWIYITLKLGNMGFMRPLDVRLELLKDFQDGIMINIKEGKLQVL